MKYDILGVKVDNATMDEAVSTLSGWLGDGQAHIVVTPNAEILLMCENDAELRAAIDKASFVSADGVGVLKAAQILGTPLKEKVAGCDLGLNLLKEAAKKDKGVFLFGSKPGVAELAAKNLCENIPGLRVCGVRNGYFKPEDVDGIVDEINESGADILWVCLGAPKQEKWMADNAGRLRVSVMMGLGGSIDVYAGTVKRAPRWMIKLKLEWLYRLVKEPWRFSRMIKIPRIISVAKKEKKRRDNDARA